MRSNSEVLQQIYTLGNRSGFPWAISSLMVVVIARSEEAVPNINLAENLTRSSSFSYLDYRCNFALQKQHGALPRGVAGRTVPSEEFRSVAWPGLQPLFGCRRHFCFASCCFISVETIHRKTFRPIRRKRLSYPGL